MSRIFPAAVELHAAPLLLSDAPVAVGSVLWRDARNRLKLTIVAKATYELTPGSSPRTDALEPIHLQDFHFGDPASTSVAAPSDTAPFKRHGEVVLVGSAIAAKPTACHVARVIVGDVEKSLEVHSARWLDPAGAIAGSSPETRFSLHYERAAGGLGTDNPVGLDPTRLDARGWIQVPEIVPPALPVSSHLHVPPCNFGPVAASWRSRASLLSVDDAAWVARPADLPLPAGFPMQYFQAAPSDQRLSHDLGVNQRVILEGLHPDIPRLLMNLVGGELVATMPLRPSIRLVPDLLVIDTDRGVCTLTHRASIDVHHPDGADALVIRVREVSLGDPLAVELLEADTSDSEPVARSRRRTTEELQPLLAARTVDARPLERGLPFRAALDGHGGDGRGDSETRPALRVPTVPGGLGGGDPQTAARVSVSAGSPAAVAVSAGSPAGVPSPVRDVPPPPPSVRSSSPPRPLGAVTDTLATSGPPVSTGSPVLTGSPGGAPSRPPPPPLAPTFGPPPPLRLPSTPPPPEPIRAVVLPEPVKPIVPSPGPPGWTSIDAAPLRPASVTPPPPSLRAAALGFDAAFGTVKTASDAAAGPSRVVEAAFAEPPVAGPAARPTSGRQAVVRLLASEGGVGARVRRSKRFASLLTRPAQRLDEVRAAEPSDERHDILRILSFGTPATPAEVLGALPDGLGDPDGVEPPLLLVGGELRPTFDEMDTLRALVAVVQPISAGDKRVTGPLSAAQTALASSAVIRAEATRAIVRQVNQACATLNVPAGFVLAEVERVLMEGRKYKRRTVLGGTQIRADWVLKNGEVLPCYLPEAAAAALPMLPSFPALALAELTGREDFSESHDQALLVLALVRVLSTRADAANPQAS